jgi:nucleoporin NUP159
VLLTSTVSSISWLANDEFLTIHSASSPPADSPPEAVFHWLRTDKNRTQFEFRKAPIEPCFALLNRSPSSYFISRIRKWSQLEDAVLVTSSASSDVGLFTNSQAPLNTQDNAADITNVYTLTSLENDARKAALPMSLADSTDTFPIGQAIDYSSKDKVWQPIPGDDTISGDSAHPLPALAVLNHEGFLSYWWFVNDEAVRKAVPCPGLTAVADSPTVAQTSVSSPIQPNKPVFGNSSFGTPQPTSTFGTPSISKPPQSAFGQTGFAKPAQPAFGQTGFGSQSAAQQPAFGKPAFGATPTLGSASPWGTPAAAKPAAPAFGQSAFGSTATPVAKPSAPAFGQPAFGSSSTPAGHGFGQTGTLGLGQSSPWGTPAAASTNTPKSAFGGDTAATSGFAKFAANPGASSFASMATSKPAGNGTMGSAFGSLGGAKPAAPFGGLKQEPSFGQTPQQSFGSTITLSSAAGGSTLGGQSVFGSTFGTPAKPGNAFSPASSFKTEVPDKKKDEEMADDTTATQSKAAESTPSGSSLFGLKTPFRVAPTFKPAETAKEKDQDEAEPKTTSTGFGLGSLGANLGTATPEPEVKPDPELPKKSLFDITPRPTQKEDISSTTEEKDATPPTTKANEQPEPPEVTSKPAPSSSSGTFSGESSTIVKSTEVEDNIPSSPPESEDDGEDEGIEDDEDGEDNADAEDDDDDYEDELSSDQQSEVVATPPRTGSGPASSPPSGLTASPTSDPSTTPFGTTPSAPKSVLNLKNSSFPRSPLGESTGVPPPAPTPPVSGLPRPFPTFRSSTTPAGLPQGPLFAPPKQQESPRSPSPIRRSSKPVAQPVQITVVPQPALISRTGSSQLIPAEVKEVRTNQLSDLRDDADDAIRESLAKPIEPTLTIPAFIAHTDYAGRVSLDGVPGNIERVYRDINSMIDTLGQNARALASFVAGHQEGSDADADGTDLYDTSRKWTLDDIDRLKSLEHNLERTLLQDPIKNTNDLRNEIVGINRKLRPTKEDQKKMKAFLQAYKDPSAQNKRRNAPLDPNAAAYQRELLTQLAIFKKALAEAEDKATMVKAKLASRGAAKQAPTVEAVEKTIRKMTAMVQKRSGEVDYLETQMRKLGIVSGSRPGSTRNSPAKGRSFGLVATNEEDEDEADDEEFQWRIERTVEVRAKRRAILNKIKEELDKRDLSSLQKAPEGY